MADNKGSIVVNNLPKILMSVRAMRAASVGIGYPQGGSGGEIHPDSNVTYAELAQFHELGTSKMPPRPFMRQGAEIFHGESAEIAPMIASAIEGVLPVTALMEGAGKLVKGGIEKAVARQNFAPLAPSTLAQKKGGEILIETGELVKHLEVKVGL